jgi:hypothetical protein
MTDAPQNERDWADDMADEILFFLAKCRTAEQESELIAAYLRLEKQAGKVDGVHTLSTALGVPPMEEDYE